MQLVEVVRDETMMVPGYEDQTFECSSCHEVERRRTFRGEGAWAEETAAASALSASAAEAPVVTSAPAMASPDVFVPEAVLSPDAQPAAPQASAGAGEVEDGEEMLKRAIAMVRAPVGGSQPVRGLTDRPRTPAALGSAMRAKKAGRSRLIQIRHDPSYEAAFAAKDTKTGLVVLRHQDSIRLRSMCERLGWQVLEDGAASEE
jgi:hypothetical protein